MSLEEWQLNLRRQFGRVQPFQLQNLGEEPIFSEFDVTNPASRRTYRVVVRGENPGDNLCSCPDYATNTLGTCKHIEFTLERLREEKGAAEVLREGFVPRHAEVWLRNGSRRQVVFRRGSETPKALRTLAGRFFDRHGVLREESFARFDRFVHEATALDPEFACHEAALDFVAEHRDAEHRAATLDERYHDPASSLAGLLKVRLYPYQQEGALFAARAGRALLGDEMGLGKTVQAIAFAAIMGREFGVERVLIVCPSSLKYQWKQEIEKFTGTSALVIEGLVTARHLMYQRDSFFTIVNYDVIHRDLEAIARMAPDIVILDEAQRIKNWKTRTAQAVKAIDSPYALVLTGTPLENRLEELYSIVQFVDRHRLGPLFRFRAAHQVTDGETGKVVGYRQLASIGETLAPVLLRRKKAEVLDQLPDRIDNNYFVAMTPQQRDIHDEQRELVGRLVQKWRRYKFLSESDQRRLTIALQIMRMSCDSTYLVDHVTRFGPKVDELMQLLEELFEEPGSQVVIFSQWTRMNDLIAEALSERGWGHVYLHGGVPSKERPRLIARFHEDPSVRVFLSTDAGGVGLNLQVASTVINMDLPWNPAILEQRIGRVHRLGQRHTVRVVNFVSQGTIEDGMLNVLRFKQSLFAGVLDGGDDEIFMDGSRLQKFIESVEAISGGIPAMSPDTPTDEPETATDGISTLTDEPEASASSPEAPRGLSEARSDQPQDSATAPREALLVPSEPPREPASPSPESPVPADGRIVPDPEPGMPTAPHAPPRDLPASPPMSPLVAAGVTFLKELGGLLATRTAPDGGVTAGISLETDERSGRPVLKVPLPPPEVLGTLVEAARPLLEWLQSQTPSR